MWDSRRESHALFVSKSELFVALSRSATLQNPDASTPFAIFRGVLAPEIREVRFHFAVLARLQASQGKAGFRSCTWNDKKLVLFVFQCGSFLGTCDWHDDKRKNYSRVLCDRFHRPGGGLRGASLRALRAALEKFRNKGFRDRKAHLETFVPTQSTAKARRRN